MLYIPKKEASSGYRGTEFFDPFFGYLFFLAPFQNVFAFLPVTRNMGDDFPMNLNALHEPKKERYGDTARAWRVVGCEVLCNKLVGIDGTF